MPKIGTKPKNNPNKNLVVGQVIHRRQTQYENDLSKF